MILTIDGPAGAGKSSVTRKLAERLGFQFLDTGAMYRAVTWAAMEAATDLNDEPSLIRLMESLDLQLSDDAVIVNGLDVTDKIRQREVTLKVSAIADSIPIRQHLVELQRRIAATGDYVCEGRDQGTVVFPDAVCKIYLTASPEQRAQRRMDQLIAAGQFVDYDQILREQAIRDRQDESRPFGALARAEDAVEVNTDHKSMDEVVGELEQIAREQFAAKQE
jgi:cytidylate kinase